MSRSPRYCWSCAAQIMSRADGVSLSGDQVQHVCCRCHEALTPAQRIALGALLRRRSDGGVGLRESLASIAGLCEWIRAQGLDALRAAADSIDPDADDDEDDPDWTP